MYVCTFIHMYIHTFLHIYVYSYRGVFLYSLDEEADKFYTHAHTHTHTHTHTQACSSTRSPRRRTRRPRPPPPRLKVCVCVYVCVCVCARACLNIWHACARELVSNIIYMCMCRRQLSAQQQPQKADTAMARPKPIRTSRGKKKCRTRQRETAKKKT